MITHKRNFCYRSCLMIWWIHSSMHSSSSPLSNLMPSVLLTETFLLRETTIFQNLQGNLSVVSDTLRSTISTIFECSLRLPLPPPHFSKKRILLSGVCCVCLYLQGISSDDTIDHSSHVQVRWLWTFFWVL